MKRHFLAMFAFVACALGALAQGFPTVSTAENTVWYLIQFVNGGNAITAETSGTNVTTSSAVGSAAQLWKVTGDNTNGYQLTNKKGYTLHVASAAKNQMVQASASASGVSKFTLTANGSNYEIQPKGNTGVSMNLWGGPNENRGVGLWDKGDQNNPVTFVDASAYEGEAKFSLIPYPQELIEGEGSLIVAALSAITYNSEEMKEHVEAFAAQLKTASGITLAVKKAADVAEAGEIWFGTDNTLPRDGYTLEVKKGGVEIKTSTFGGELYALQTLMQLLPSEFFASELCTNNCSATWSLPVVTIMDNPQFEHRGFMMDVARHFFDKDEVKKVLDIMAFYKLNRFHWHLTDDQGWRIEIPEYPKLTEVGAVRAGSFTNNGDGQKFFDDTEYGRGMWFSQDDLREIVAYAAERNIDILPEIDLPGHMVAAVASYPEFSCDPTKKYEVRIDGGISHDVLNVGKDEVIDFLKCVLGHVAEIFPFPYIHLGGDECPTEQWANNADCLRRVQEEGLAGVQELQSWLVEELGVFLKTEYGKDIVVWDEVLANWNKDNTTTPVIMAWNQSGALSKNAANLGFNSILCPYSHVYIDFPQVPESQMFIDEPYYGGWGTNTIERVYSLNPVAYLEGQEEFCWGAQANLWAETLNDNEELEYCLLPRILALAEVGWLPVEKKDWIGFYRRLQSHDEILDQLGYTYAKHYIEPKEYTATEQAIMEAEEILAASVRGGVGYPAAANYDALQEVLEATKASSLNTDALIEAIAAYKAAPLVQPEAGKTYRILSASTYFKRQYEGSSMYQKGNGVNFHYTPQTEPEELWQFVPSGDGYILTNCYSGGKLSMDTYNAAVTITDKGTPIRMDKATIEAGGYTYIPGAVTLSAVSGYSATVTGSVKRLSAELSGQVYAEDEARLCYNGTWRIEEVTDYTAWLQGMVDKCEHIILTAEPGETNEPTAEALEYLKISVIAPAKAALSEGAVTKEQYDEYAALYLQFQQMERTGIAQGLSEEYYYHLRNVWFGKYAAVNTSSKTVNHQSSKGNGDNYLWQVVKQPGGSVYLINKATGTAAYPASDGDQTIKVGKNYAWTLEERTLDGKTGICIIDAAGANSWYTNPDVWTYLLLKPFWGACTWEFQQTNIKVVEEGGDTPVVPQTDGIFPQPQQVQWGAEKAFDNTVAYNLVGAADADADAVALINKHFATENGTINLTIGERGDAAVAAYESLIPAKSEGYYLKVSKDGVVIAGNDAEGTFYGVQTYLQVAAHAEVKTVTITDWPSISDRGLVEGYYGNPYSDADRKSLLEFFGRTKMNVYIYGPKDDPYHLDRWREDYPAEEAERFEELVAVAKRNKVRFVWAMHPGKDIQWTDADRAASVAKLEKMYALGIRAFSIFFDDINGAEQSKGDKQAEYLNYLNENFVKKHTDVAPIIMCPTQYNKAYTGGNDTYLNALGTTLDAETHIMWTGNSVVDMIGKGDMEWVNTRIKRNAYIWLNYPVTDYCRDHILMGPTFGNDLDIAPLLGGFVSNPMEYAEASKVSLYSIGDYCWNMEAYDADASWESAIKFLMPELSKEFRLFCENNVDLGDNVHGLRRTNESASFVEAREAFNDLMAQGNTASAVASLREHFNLMANAATKLMASNYNPALTVEITPWCEVMNYMALKGLELANMYDALEAAQPETFIESYVRYQEYDEAQSAVRSRDFEGSIRVARPAVGSYHIIPFLKNTLDALVAEYKAHYDFGLDVFPGQEVENGDYFIMYDGKYLTNQSEGVTGTAPAFVEKRDDVKPQRQEWNIAIDPATGRYKIVNRQDDRYLNEKGEFTVSDATNPYEAAWHTYNIMRLANGKYCIQNGGSAKTETWTVSSSRVTKSGSSIVEPACFIFDLVPVNGTAVEAPIVSTRDVYYIMDGDRYLTNTNPGGTGGAPTFQSVATLGDAQEWRITIDAAGKNHYKIASDADGRYINEHGVFGTNAYYADWNTYLILTMDDMCAVQITQSAANNLGAHFWNIKNDRLEVDSELDRQSSYIIKIVAKGEVTGPDPEPGVLKLFTVNGSIDGPDNTALPSKVMAQQALDVVLRGAPGYAAKGLTVRYGVNPNGAEFDAEGNRQWTEKYVAATNGKATIPAEMIEGDVNLYATFEHEEGSEWHLVFSDEFNAENYSQPVADKWMRCQRYSATWNRWLSDSEEVIYLEDGDLVARAIPNPDKASDPVDMITGGIKSNGRFGFTYGYVEARIYNNLWRGNFPAFWMMPEDQSLGWPDCGEIDIWEVIDTENRSYHTVHSNWTYDLGNTGNPKSSFNTNCSYDRYHTYGLAWDATSLIWYLDGKEVGRYTKSTNQSHLDQGQWPFDKHFHLILNQSVGNGAWAANADITHTYETRFDWVRVYQKEGMMNTNGIVDDISVVEQDAPESDAIYTLQGVRLEGSVENLPKGIYIVGGKKVVIK